MSDKKNEGRSDLAHFEIFDIDDCVGDSKFDRRDFFKIAVMDGDYIYHYANKSIRVSGLSLMFFSPDVPYRSEILSKVKVGYFCAFDESFFSEQYKRNLQQLPMFASRGKYSYRLNKSQNEFVNQIFKKIRSELKSDYAFRLELIRNYVTELIHFAMKMNPLGAIDSKH